MVLLLQHLTEHTTVWTNNVTIKTSMIRNSKKEFQKLWLYFVTVDKDTSNSYSICVYLTIN